MKLNTHFFNVWNFTPLFAASCSLTARRNGQRAPNESRSDEKSNHLHDDLHLHPDLHEHCHLRCEPSTASQWHGKEQLCSHGGHHLPQPTSTFRQKSCSGAVMLSTSSWALFTQPFTTSHHLQLNPCNTHCFPTFISFPHFYFYHFPTTTGWRCRTWKQFLNQNNIDEVISLGIFIMCVSGQVSWWCCG